MLFLFIFNKSFLIGMYEKRGRMCDVSGWLLRRIGNLFRHWSRLVAMEIKINEKIARTSFGAMEMSHVTLYVENYAALEATRNMLLVADLKLDKNMKIFNCSPVLRWFVWFRRKVCL